MDVASITFKADSRDLDAVNKKLAKLEKQSAKTERASSKIEKSFSTIGASAKTAAKVGLGVFAVGAATVTAGLFALNKVMREAVTLANVQERAETKLAAVLNSTGEAAGFNLKQLKDMAGAMQGVTTVGDEVILSGMSILATFKQVKGDAFEGATKAALDMSAVMEQDLKSSVIQIGKALNDPIVGLTALGRAGVTFTEQQKEQIKVLQKSGDMYGAQSIILAELESQFGGAAAALRDNYAGAVEAAGNAFGDYQEQLGFVITKTGYFTEAAKIAEEVFIGWTKSLSDSETATDDLARTIISKLVGALQLLVETMRFVENGWLGIQWVAQGAIHAMIIGMEQLFGTIRRLLIPLDLLFKGAVKLGALDVNPFDNIGNVLDDLNASTGMVFDDINEKIIETNDRYDEWGKKIEETKERILEAGGALDEYVDSWRPLAKEIDKATDAQKDFNDKSKEAISWQDKLEESLDQLSGTSYESFQSASQDVKDYSNLTLGEVESIDQALTDFFDDIPENQEVATTASVKLWEDFVGNTGEIVHSFVSDTLKGEFDSVGELFKGLLDSMLEMFLDFISKVIANSLIDAIFGGGASGSPLTFSNLLSGVGLGNTVSSAASGTSAGSGALSSLSAGGALYNAAGWAKGALGMGSMASYSGLTAGTQLALAEGTYGAALGGGTAAAASSGGGLMVADTLAYQAAPAAGAGAGAGAMAVGAGAVGGIMGIAMAPMFGFDTENWWERMNYGITPGDVSGMGVGSDLAATGSGADQSAAWQHGIENSIASFDKLTDTLVVLRDKSDESKSSLNANQEAIHATILQFDEATGKWTGVTETFKEGINQLTTKFGDATGVSMDLVAAEAARIASTLGLKGTEQELAATYLVNVGAAESLSEAMEMLANTAIGSANAAASAAAGAQASADTAQMWADKWADFQPHAKGGIVGNAFLMPEMHADGGILRGGSGIKDDLYLGTVNGRPQLAMGGEYIINPQSTKKHKRALDLINSDRFESGGMIGGQSSSTNYTIPVSLQLGQDRLANFVLKIVDDVVTIREEEGVTGRMFA